MPVVAVVGPANHAPDALDRARRSASMAMSLRHSGVLRLVQVVGYEGRVAWCYESFEGLGLAHVVGSDSAGAPTARAAAELVAQVAEVLLGLGSPGLHHPGPEPVDLVLGADGRVRLAGFAGPYPAGPAMRAPTPNAAEPAAVYRLGVLLATLIAGVPPAPATDATAHAVLVRRALIRAMARPGPVLSERFGQWIRGMLAWAPAERPPLSAVPAGLRAVGWATGGESLADWAARRVPEMVETIQQRHQSMPGLLDDIDEDLSDPGVLREIAEDGPPPPRRATLPDLGPISQTPTPTATAPRRVAPERDDDTQEATIDPTAGPGQAWRNNPGPEPLSIPVDIGPPADAVVLRAPSLPPGFLTGEDLDDDTSGPVAGEPTRAPPPSTPVGIWLGAVGGLLILALVFVAYLLLGGARDVGPIIDGPRLRLDVEDPPELEGEGTPDVPVPGMFETDLDTDYLTGLVDDVDPQLPPATPRDRGTYIRFRLAPGVEGSLGVRCEGRGPETGGREHLLERLQAGQVCTVWGVDGSGVRRAETRVTVSGIATVDCFHDWSSTCLD